MTTVVRFPPLPPMPAPPLASPDPRQETFHRIVGNLQGQLGAGTTVAANTDSGYRASAVDLGHLQEILGDAIRLFDMKAVNDRWEDDLGEWFRRTVVAWIQRLKSADFSIKDNGIHVTMETQDDRGYYQYEFDVFPGKRARHAAPHL